MAWSPNRCCKLANGAASCPGLCANRKSVSSCRPDRADQDNLTKSTALPLVSELTRDVDTCAGYTRTGH